MSLTDEQRAAALAARHAARERGESATEAVYEAGLRMGRAEMREQAEKVAFDYLRPHHYPKARAWTEIAEGCAAAIRALPEETP